MTVCYNTLVCKIHDERYIYIYIFFYWDNENFHSDGTQRLYDCKMKGVQALWDHYVEVLAAAE